jgi:hypothetical protein
LADSRRLLALLSESDALMRCAECDAELELDEPQTCYFTGRGPCGDCRDPRTNQPMNCFHPVTCEDCQRRADRRARRRQQVADLLSTREYTERRKAELRDRRPARFT